MYNIHNGYKAFENTLSYQDEARENDENCFRKFLLKFIIYIIPHFNRDNFYFRCCFPHYNGLHIFLQDLCTYFLSHVCVYYFFY